MLLRRAVKSVLNQTFKSFEIIIVIDGSDSSTNEVLKQENDPRIIVLELPVKVGGAEARNAGIIRARGEWIAFLDDDDEWLPTKLEKQAIVFKSLPNEYAVLDTGYIVTYKNNKTKSFMPELRGSIFNELLVNPRRGKAPVLSSILCRKSVLYEVGLFDNSFASRQDIDLYLRIARIYLFENIREILVVSHRQSINRITDNIGKRISGCEVFHEKYYDELQKRPKCHSIFLRQYGNLLLRNDNIDLAKQQYKASLNYNPFNIKSIVLYLSTIPKPISSMVKQLLNHL